MTVYIALLRGINVGGKNMIKMAHLKTAFEDLGLKSVQTYIQSGNVLFKSGDGETHLLSIIKQKIEQTFGFSVNVVLRTADELKSLIEHCPFSSDDIAQAENASEAESLYAGLLSHVPSQESIMRLDKYKNESEKCIIAGRDVYLLFHESIRNSKLANHLTKLDEAATVRNWKTLTHLNQLAADMWV